MQVIIKKTVGIRDNRALEVSSCHKNHRKEKLTIGVLICSNYTEYKLHPYIHETIGQRIDGGQLMGAVRQIAP